MFKKIKNKINLIAFLLVKFEVKTRVEKNVQLKNLHIGFQKKFP